MKSTNICWLPCHLSVLSRSVISSMVLGYRSLVVHRCLHHARLPVPTMHCEPGGSRAEFELVECGKRGKVYSCLFFCDIVINIFVIRQFKTPLILKNLACIFLPFYFVMTIMTNSEPECLPMAPTMNGLKNIWSWSLQFSHSHPIRLPFKGPQLRALVSLFVHFRDRMACRCWTTLNIWFSSYRFAFLDSTSLPYPRPVQRQSLSSGVFAFLWSTVSSFSVHYSQLSSFHEFRSLEKLSWESRPGPSMGQHREDISQIQHAYTRPPMALAVVLAQAYRKMKKTGSWAGSQMLCLRQAMRSHQEGLGIIQPVCRDVSAAIISTGTSVFHSAVLISTLRNS